MLCVQGAPLRRRNATQSGVPAPERGDEQESQQSGMSGPSGDSGLGTSLFPCGEMCQSISSRGTAPRSGLAP